MPNAYRNLGQAALAAGVLTDLYAVPAARSAIISSLILCNRGGPATTIRVSVAIAGAADAVAQYLYYDVPLSGNDTFVAMLGLSLAATDVLRVQAANANCSASAFGTEMS